MQYAIRGLVRRRLVSFRFFAIFVRGAFLFFLLFACPVVYAGTYYVDYQSGADTNNGLSTSAPWKHSPGDTACSAVCASTTLQLGDTVKFKGGVIYTGTGSSNKVLITIGSSGSAGNYITYDGNSAGTWGTGKAIIDLNSTYRQAFFGSAKSYIKILNFDITHAKNNTSTASVPAGSCPAGQTKVRRNGSAQCVTYSGGGTIALGYIQLYNNSNNWIIKDCKIHETENYTDMCVTGAETDGDPSTSSSVPADQVGINVYNSNNVEIDSCEIYAVGRDAIRMYGSNVYVHDCDIGGRNAGASTGYFSVAFRVGGNNHRIANNRIHDGYQYGYGACHANDWIHMYGNNNHILDSGDTYNITIERNSFYNDTVFIESGGTATMFLEDDTYNITIRNNLFLNPFSFMVELESVDQIYIYNNTFLNFKRPGLQMPIYLTANNLTDPAVPTIKIKNNIFYNQASGAAIGIYATTPNPTESDYNVFYNTNFSSVVAHGSSSYTLDQWKAQTCGTGPCDAHSSAVNPNLALIPATGATTSSGQYWLTATSVNAIDKGTTLPGFTDDINGLIRSGLWDIGAYEYVSGTSNPVTCNTVSPANFSQSAYTSYGAPYDLFASNAQLVDAKCTSSDPTTISATIGKTGDTTRIVYAKGYYFDPGISNWVPYTSTCTGTLNGDWCAGPVTATITDADISTASAGTPAYFVGMVCSVQGGGWKCGCRDTNCTNFYWQIQGAGQ